MIFILSNLIQLIYRYVRLFKLQRIIVLKVNILVVTIIIKNTLNSPREKIENVSLLILNYCLFKSNSLCFFNKKVLF